MAHDIIVISKQKIKALWIQDNAAETPSKKDKATGTSECPSRIH